MGVETEIKKLNPPTNITSRCKIRLDLVSRGIYEIVGDIDLCRRVLPRTAPKSGPKIALAWATLVAEKGQFMIAPEVNISVREA
jgi:hypothetical protein